jgi:hypothetical protein
MTNKLLKNAGSQNSKKQPVIAKKYYSGFELDHNTYGAISAASDGKIYYILSSQSIDTGGKIYTLARFDYNGAKIKDLVKIPGPFTKP